MLVCGDFLGLSFSLSFATAEIRDYVVRKLLVDMVCV